MPELRHALRRLSRTPGFTALAVVTLALGIGASTALFSVVNGVLLRPLAYRQPGQLVWVRERMPVFGEGLLPVNAWHFVTWRERSASCAGFSVVDSGSVTLTGRDRPQQLALAAVSADFFDLLGVGPVLGRGFASGEDTDGRNRVVVISDGFWRREFGGDPAVIGSRVLLDHQPHTVVGVLPAGFTHPAPPNGPRTAAAPDVIRPKVFSAEELQERVGRHNYGTIARLKPGVTLPQAADDLNRIEAQIMREAGASNLVLRAQIVPLQEAIVGASRRGLLVLFGAVSAVLLIGCVNLMNFLLARAEQRRHESAVRQALGAGRGRLVGEALAESMLVALGGGVLGVGLAQLGLSLLLRHAPVDLPRLAEVRLDAGVLLFALAVTIATGIVFGLVPAWRLARADPQQALGSARTVAGAGGRLSRALIAGEVTLSLVLLVTAALLGTSFARLLRTPQGFDGRGVLTARVGIPYSRYSEGEQRNAFFERLLERLSALPGVRSAAIVSALPLQGETWIDKASLARDPRPAEEKPNVNVRFVSADYFQTLGIAVRGRTFDRADRQRSVAIISQSLADRLCPGREAIGQRFERNPGDEYEVIGVAADVRVAADRAPVPMVYRPYWIWPPFQMTVVLRAANDPRQVTGGFLAALRGLDPDVPAPTFRTMSDVLLGSVEQQRFQLLLAGAFAASALLLTALGLYGVVAYAVSRRRRELGIRLALGATPGAVRWLVIRQGMRPVWLGLIVGTGLTLVLGQVLNALLYQTSPTDPVTLGIVGLALAGTAALACYLPGRRTSEVDPIAVLKDC
jgi:putative ABC transport system permease protein